MGLAAQLLRNPSMLIATVADKVGFGSDVAFYRAFRRHFGQSPGAFRLAQGGVSGFDDAVGQAGSAAASVRSEEHTSELQSLMRISYAVFCLKKKNIRKKYCTQPR